jgi:hypothetical protein
MTEPAGEQSSKYLLLGLCLTAMATVLLELVLTRLFSATVGYHFAFMIVSLTMFGMTLGALVTLVQSAPDADSVSNSLVTNAYLFAISVIAVFLGYNVGSPLMLAAGPLIWITLSFVLFSIPFYFSGICICLCLSRFQEVGKLYSADLIGAGLSCPLLVIGLSFTDGQGVLTCAGLLAGLGGLCFAAHKKIGARRDSETGRLLNLGGVIVVFCTAALFLPRFPINIGVDQPIEYVKWSPVGRVVVTTFEGPAVSWAKVPIRNPPQVDQKGLYIDFGAFTVMTSGKATIAQLETLKRDITAVGNYLRPGTSLFVIGVGGGRDVLTGLLFGQRSIDGIEVNPAIVHMLTRKYADFVGHLGEKPGVNIINDEARNWLARSDKRYGLIQCSLVDTWSASSSGAFMLTENVLYTKEAFELYLKHLEPRGILSFLRWGDEHEPGQILRMLNLAKYATSRMGITDFGSHLILIGAPYRIGDHTIGDMLVSLQPFSSDDIERVQKLAEQEGFKLLWLPAKAGDKPVAAVEPFASLIRNQNTFNPGMPSDDSPFFFTPVNPSNNESSMAEPAQGKGLALLLFTFCLSIILVVSTIVVPAWTKMRLKLGSLREIVISAAFFAFVGLAFMQVEVGQIERLTVMLGNPTYSLSVVLFALLLASGIGSYLAEVLQRKGHDPVSLLRQGLISSMILVAVSALASLFLLQSLAAAQTSLRIIAAIALVSIPALFMGWGFPLGMTIFTRKNPNAGAWFWAINGTASVLGSVLAAIFSITLGITATMMIGSGFYFLAWMVALLPLGITDGALPKIAGPG